MNAPTAAVQFTFVDRDLNESRVTMYLPFEVGGIDGLSFALGAVSRFNAISSALIRRVTVTWRHTIDDPGQAGFDSTIYRNLYLFLGNANQEIDLVVIPSPIDLWETTGPYAGIRADLTRPELEAFQQMVQTVTTELRTQDNRELGPDIIVGGLAT